MSRFRHKGDPKNKSKAPSQNSSQAEASVTPSKENMMFTFSAKMGDTSLNKASPKKHKIAAAAQEPKRKRTKGCEDSNMLHNWTYEPDSSDHCTTSKTKTIKGINH